MKHSTHARALAGAALLLVVAPVAVSAGAQQQQQSPAPVDSVAAAAGVAPSGLSVQMTQEIYVAAFRASARRWCAAAGGRGGDEPLRSALESTHLISHGGVVEAERGGVDQAVDSAYTGLVRDGGCAALVERPTAVVVVDRFEGHKWNAPKREVAPRDRGDASEAGTTVVTRGVKLGRRRFHRIGADADFVFTTQRQQLVRGRYRVPATDRNFADRWKEVESLVGADFPTLRVARSEPRPAVAGAEPTYAARSGPAAWRTAFTNPDTQALEVRMYAVPAAGRDGAWTIVVDYVGYAGR